MKYAEIKELPTKELIERYKEETVRLQKLKFQDAVTKLDQPHKVRESKKLVARYLTEINARRIDNEIKAFSQE